MQNITSIKLTAYTRFRPGAGEEGILDKESSIDDILKKNEICFDNFYINLTQKSEKQLQGNVSWQYEELILDAGIFTLDFENRFFSTPFLNVSYDTHCILIIKALFEFNDTMNIRKTIQNINENAIVNKPATENEIKSCNTKLSENNIPPLPKDIADFLKICNGMEFNGMQIFGTNDNEIINSTIQNRNYRADYEDIEYLIFFGRIDDDLYTYNLRTKKYESRDICCLDIWDEYDTFDDFFTNEMMKWLV